MNYSITLKYMKESEHGYYLSAYITREDLPGVSDESFTRLIQSTMVNRGQGGSIRGGGEGVNTPKTNLEITVPRIASGYCSHWTIHWTKPIRGKLYRNVLVVPFPSLS